MVGRCQPIQLAVFLRTPSSLYWRGAALVASLTSVGLPVHLVPLSGLSGI